MAYHIREISHRRNDITARNISPVDSNKVEERNISSKLCTLKPNQCASLPSRLFKEYSHAQQQLFTSHFRYILKLFTLHLDLKEHRNGQLKYTHDIFLSSSSLNFGSFMNTNTHIHTHTHTDLYIFEGKLLSSLSQFFHRETNFLSFESKKKLLSSTGFNNDATGIIPLSPPHPSPSLPPEYLTENTTYVLRVVNSIFFSL